MPIASDWLHIFLLFWQCAIAALVTLLGAAWRGPAALYFAQVDPSDAEDVRPLRVGAQYTSLPKKEKPLRKAEKDELVRGTAAKLLPPSLPARCL